MLIYFLQDFYDEIADQIFKLREQREKCTVNTAARDAQIARIYKLQKAACIACSENTKESSSITRYACGRTAFFY